MNKSLLDTDTLSEIGRGIDPIVTRNALVYRGLFGRFTLSTVTLMEVVRGSRRKQGNRRVQAFAATIGSMEILPFDALSAELAGRIIADLDRAGRPIGITDPMIAAIALTQGLELVTGNTAHFGEIRRLGHPLMLENWRI